MTPTARTVRRMAPWVALAVTAFALVMGASTVRASLAGSTRWEAGAGAASPTGSRGPAPTRLRIRTIGVDAPLEELRLDATGALEAPKDFARPGWYAGGNAPGEVGPAVIAGHVDSHDGPAVFVHLHKLRKGDTVEVARGDGLVRFQVLAVHRYPKDRFPTDEVHGPTPNPQLRLITCGGAFDNTRRSYRDNIVVYAVAI